MLDFRDGFAPPSLYYPHTDVKSVHSFRSIRGAKKWGSRGSNTILPLEAPKHGCGDRVLERQVLRLNPPLFGEPRVARIWGKRSQHSPVRVMENTPNRTKQYADWEEF